jgi:hypothetical protein
MTTKQAKAEATIDCPKTNGKLTLHPATFGLLEWLQTKRKNPVICGGTVEMKHAIELCFAFTKPSVVITAIPDAKVAEQVKAFTHSLTPELYKTIEAHAQKELLKFQRTAVAPKKSKAGAQPPKKRK